MTGPKTAENRLLSDNRVALEEHHPQVLRRILAGLPASPRPEPVIGADASFSLRLGPALLHDPVDPEREARETAAAAGIDQASTALVFGFGAGYLLEAACDAAPADAGIGLVVVDPQAFLTTLEHRDVASVLCDPRLTLIAGDLKSIATSMPAVDESLVVLTHLPVLKGSAPELAPLAQMARELSATQASRRTQIGDVVHNLARNLDRIVTAPSALELAEGLRGKPALLVAPGPSLDGQLPLLASSPLPYLVALDTALRPLSAAGVQPDLAVTLDPTPGNVTKFEGIRLDCPLVFFAGARPEALDLAAHAVFACEEGGILDQAHPWFGRGGRFHSNGSVLLAALDVLITCGADPIVLVGADLAHTGGRAHAAGVGPRSSSGVRRVPRRGGGEIETSESLWRHWRRLNRRLRDLPHGRVIDATADGAALESAQRVRLADWLEACPRQATPPLTDWLTPVDEPDGVRTAALTAVEALRS